MASLRYLALIPLLFGLASCQSNSALRNSPDFRAGYSDGCASAGSPGANPRESGIIRDESAYRSNAAYRAGWGTGFNACRSYQAPRGPTLPGQGPMLPGQGPNPF